MAEVDAAVVAAGENRPVFAAVFPPAAKRGGRLWPERPRRKAWPLATAFGGKGLTARTYPALLATKRCNQRDCAQQTGCQDFPLRHLYADFDRRSHQSHCA